MFAIAAVLVAATAAGVALVVWVADQLYAIRRGSTHVVYLLIDARGTVLYCGSTNDVDRRFAEHRRGDDPWRGDIAGFSVARRARSEAQARRCEARLVRVLVAAGRWKLGPPPHNEVLFERRGSVLGPVWVVSWLALSVLFDGCRWHRTNPRHRLYRHPQPHVDTSAASSSGRVDVSFQPSPRQPVRHPSHVVGGLLQLIADAGPDPQPQVEVGPSVSKGRRRGARSEDERAAARRASNAAAARRYRARKTQR
jgi:hypothetical protein